MIRVEDAVIIRAGGNPPGETPVMQRSGLPVVISGMLARGRSRQMHARVGSNRLGVLHAGGNELMLNQLVRVVVCRAGKYDSNQHHHSQEANGSRQGQVLWRASSLPWFANVFLPLALRHGVMPSGYWR